MIENFISGSLKQRASAGISTQKANEIDVQETIASTLLKKAQADGHFSEESGN